MHLLRKAAALVVATMALGLGACGEKEEAQKDKLLEIIAASRPLPHSFTYVDQPLTGTEIRVVGVVEDSLRFKGRLEVNGTPVKEEVARDDALAVRFLDPARIGFFVDEERVQDALKAPTSTGGEPLPTPLATLEAGRWVLDSTGAPSLLPRADVKRHEGEDPMLDALAVLHYVEQIVEANGAVRYNKNALEPVYRPQEDRFPKPDEGAAVKRYDVPMREFPKASDQGGRNVVIVPGVENFRKLSVFVKDERIIEVREDIDVDSRMEDLKRNFEVRGDFTAQQATTAINEVRKSKGEDPFRPRRMRLQLVYNDDATVELPAEGESLRAPLSFLRNRGADIPKRPAAAGGSTAETTPTSTVNDAPAPAAPSS